MRPNAAPPPFFVSPVLWFDGLWLVALIILMHILTGCGVSRLAPPSAQTGVALHGHVHGGQAPVNGAHVYLFAANTSGYGGYGLADSTANASVSLLNSADTGASDPTGAYVLSDVNGDFNISGDYTCTPGQQVYLYAHGGDSGGGSNSALGMLTLIGNCPAAGTFASIPFIEIDEVSTIAAAFAFAGFASDPVHVSSNGSPQALTGIANAFATASNLSDLGTGIALTTTPAGNGTVPRSTINTLANILASCVNTADPTEPDISHPGSPSHAARPHVLPYSSPCISLGEAVSGGNFGQFEGYVFDTATVAIFIAQSPGKNVTALYTLPTPQAPFAPVLTAQPNDFTLAIPFTGAGLDYAYSIAIDAQGNVWFGNDASHASELSPLGAALSPSGGFTAGGLGLSYGVAIDTSGNAWFTAYNNTSVSEISSSGAAVSPSAGYTGGGLESPVGAAFDTAGNLWVANYSAGISRFSSSGVPSNLSGYTGGGVDDPESLAIDPSGNIWIANRGNSISKFSETGAPITTSAGFTGGGLNEPYSIAVDNSGDIWVADYGGSTGGISEFNSAGTPISASAYTGAGLASPSGIAIDGAGNVWAANYYGLDVSEFSNSGAPVSPSTGYTGGGNVYYPYAVAVDSAGNVWVTGYGYFVTELVGAAVPIETPFVQALQDSCIALRPCLPPD